MQFIPVVDPIAATTLCFATDPKPHRDKFGGVYIFLWLIMEATLYRKYV